MSLSRTGKLGVATSAASLRPVRGIAFQARQSVAEAAEKLKKWCVLVHFGARRARYISPVTDFAGLTRGALTIWSAVEGFGIPVQKGRKN